jgi:integrin alpha FG-GAP repeat containing protein 1
MSWCPTAPKFPSPKPYGHLAMGATIKYVAQLPVGVTGTTTKRLLTFTQAPSLSYASFAAPFMLLGLGRINNYLDQLVVGKSTLQLVHWKSWLGIIPNSKLIAVTYDDWYLDLFINPGFHVIWVSVVVLCAILMLGITVGVLDWLEKREDHAERLLGVHNINYDAL